MNVESNLTDAQKLRLVNNKLQECCEMLRIGSCSETDFFKVRVKIYEVQGFIKPLLEELEFYDKFE